MRAVQKRYGAVQALAGVDLEVRAGEVHALVGENGAGKSTLMKVLSGAVLPDSGDIEIEGEPFQPREPRASLDAGIAMIYQELNLAPDLSVTQNIMLGRELHRHGWLDRRKMSKRVQGALNAIAPAGIDPNARVADLGPGARQLVEVARALAFDAKVVVMDEPTSSLSRHEVEGLFEAIAELRKRGVSIIYISHFLEEVKRVSDRFTVLRDGHTVATGETEQASVESIVEAMAGRRIEEYFPEVTRVAGEPLLQVCELAGDPMPKDVTFDLCAGEVLGIAGLVGAGRSEALRVLFALDRKISGQVSFQGAAIGGETTRGLVGRGIGLLSEDRKEEGLALDMSIADNLTLSRTAAFSRWGWISRVDQRAQVHTWIDALGIRCQGPDQPVSELSGGNQQKVAIARLLHQEAALLLLDEPTRGIDVGSKSEVYRLIGELAHDGKGVVFVSSYLPELLGVCDRIAVMHRGRLGAAHPASECTEASLLDEALRGSELS